MMAPDVRACSLVRPVGRDVGGVGGGGGGGGRHTALATDGTTLLTDRSWVSQVKVGVNYKFTPGVVVAKY
jgi:hypothetical protein